jgi:SAM-dependent methyltransferase
MTIDDFDRAASTFDVDFRIQRAQAVVRQLAAQVELNPTMSALDFGCGTGLVGFELLKHIGRLTLADPSSGMLEEARRKITGADSHRVGTLLLDAEKTVLPEHYDLVVSLMALHHIPDTWRTVTLLASSVGPGGVLALADLDLEDGSFHGPDWEVHQGIDRREIKTLMEAAEFEEIRESTPWIMQKEVEGVHREYPLFLVTGRSRNPVRSAG